MIIIFYVILITFCILKCFISLKHKKIRSQYSLNDKVKVIAFFHPFCNAGGGGERVLWSAIKALHQKFPQHCYVIYSDRYDVEPLNIVRKASQTFNLNLNEKEIQIHFVQLRLCWLFLAKYYPILTLIGQNIGSLIVGFEALLKFPCDIYIDTMGASFTYPLFRLIGSSKVATYTHYPMISADMLQVVSENQSTFNNRSIIARSILLTKIKLIYYYILVFIYRLASINANVVMVNSTWTKNHIVKLWKRNVTIVYPPCNVENLYNLSLNDKKSNVIISLSQFRPEKNHELQLQSFHKLIEILKDNGSIEKPLLIIIGSCRNEQDEQLVEILRKKSIELGIDQYVKFKKNIQYDEIVDLMKESGIAIHTMINEHFGISVVDFLAAGLITVAHKSGGPKLDIITENESGFLADNCDQFANYLHKIITMSENEKQIIRSKARESTKRFSQQIFEQTFLQQISLMF